MVLISFPLALARVRRFQSGGHVSAAAAWLRSAAGALASTMLEQRSFKLWLVNPGYHAPVR